MKKLYFSVAIGMLALSGVAFAQTQNINFTFTGAVQTFTIPSCVSEVTITTHGASGSNGNASTSPAGTGGTGAIVTGTFPVTSGDVLNIFVGGQGTLTTGGFNGGGVNAGSSSAGGGGASDVRLNGTGLLNRIIVAGGGGAGGNGGCFGTLVAGGNGGPGGGNGTAGSNSSAGGGGFPGVGTFFGSFGVGCGPFQGQSGSNGSGGVGGAGGLGTSLCTSLPTSGGSGGGGFIGGGGGGAGAAGTVGCQFNDTGGGGGGAGGDCYTDPLMTATSINPGGAAAGNGLVTITYTFNTFTGTDVQTACNSFTWIDGNTYTSNNNTAIDTVVSVAGCDSIVTLNLTIVNSTTGTDVQTACDSYTWIDGITYTASNNTATDTLTNIAGCDSVVTLDLTINSVSDITTTTTGVIISANNTGATYRWLDCDNANAFIVGETGQTFTAITNGNYAVELTENGCVDTSACAAITTVGLLENSFENSLTVYPNPTSGNFVIDMEAVYENSQIVITDISGKIVYSRNISQAQILNLSIDEPAGIYFVSVQSDNKKAVILLVKQ